jgi:DNA phosphorothioation-dependent restriction protein DptG
MKPRITTRIIIERQEPIGLIQRWKNILQLQYLALNANLVILLDHRSARTAFRLSVDKIAEELCNRGYWLDTSSRYIKIIGDGTILQFDFREMVITLRYI